MLCSWTSEDTAIMERVYKNKTTIDSWDWSFIMHDWVDAEVMRRFTSCPTKGFVAKVTAFRLQGLRVCV